MLTTLQQADVWLNNNVLSCKDNESCNKLFCENNLLHTESKVITVAGTNGKGSTLVAIEAILLASNYTVASFVSPHLVTINERCRLNGCSWSESAYLAAFNRAIELTNNNILGWFHFHFLVFLLLLQQVEITVDYVLIEVGVGGRHCITNSLDPDIAVITTIDFDHTEILGNNREQIGYEKCGIFRPQIAAICGDPNPPQTILDYAEKLQSHLSVSGRDFFYQQYDSWWCWNDAEHSYSKLPLPEIPLQNAATAVAVVQHCQISKTAINNGMKNLSMSGRLQVLQQSPQILCDVAHNPQSCAFLAENLLLNNDYSRNYAICTLKGNKDIDACLFPLLEIIDHWFIYPLANEHEFIEKSRNLFEKHQISYEISQSSKECLKKVEAICQVDDRIVVFGSFQLVGDIVQAYDQNTP